MRFFAGAGRVAGDGADNAAKSGESAEVKEKKKMLEMALIMLQKRVECLGKMRWWLDQ